MQQKENIKKIPSGLPILLVSGACDPVGNNGKALTKIRDEYNKYGIRDVEIKLYENDRHEILNETDRETVYEDLLHWLDSHYIR
jgi:alpha-beta hydrolase superfamily lysophospholipase